MAWGRKKGGGRKEPQFGLGASLASLRLSTQDRIAAAENKPKKPPPKRKIEDADEDEDPPPRERKARPSRSKRRSKSRSSLTFSCLVYWGVVFALWGAIAMVGAVVWAGAHLPPLRAPILRTECAPQPARPELAHPCRQEAGKAEIDRRPLLRQPAGSGR